jgi:hypothetical protein
VLDELLGLPVGCAFRHFFAAEQLDHRCQKVAGVLEEGIEDEMGFHLLALRKAADELAAQSGFSGADVPDDDVQATAQVQRQLQLLQALQVLPGVVKIVGVR